MQALQQELWQLEGPRVQSHVGDLAWWLHRDLWKRQLWLDRDRCVAWAWLLLCWYDDENRVGEFEPVGTHPDYRRQGLGAAVCLYALRRLQEEGTGQAVVYAGGGEEDEGARALYEGVGFRPHTRAVQVRKRRP